MRKLTPISFKEVLDKSCLDLDGKIQRSVQYKVRIIKMLRRIYPIKGHLLSLFYDSTVEEPLLEIQHQTGVDEFSGMEIKYLGSDFKLIHLLTKPLDTPIFKAFMKRGEDFKWRYGVGIIFNINHCGDFIFHNFGTPEMASRGHSKIVIFSNHTDMPDILCEPLAQFINEREGDKNERTGTGA